MKMTYVIFYLDTSDDAKQKEDHFDRGCGQKEFPQDWRHIGSSKFYTDKDQDYDFLECPTIENALTWIKGHLRSNHIYKICKWTIEENIKVFDNCPSLVEVETE